ncbi:phage tail spike protein [Liquorilactobacillus mali]|uniref:phage tail spike protein n=1 Tax=Liquorilactobacillus mali TaxID=1618 RepID=UPI00264C052B|nr:phage tail spike protein [Liquorilactobacillus mali]MDN7145144.1 phage tail spike protein [Liquorilactobacillus mali]
MIVLYDTTETKFTSNGLGLLDHDIINPIIEESANGTFKLSFDYPLSGICGSRIGRRMYIKADDPDTEGNIFKIYNIEKSDGMLSIIAFQVANEFNNNWIEHTNIMGKNGQSALDQMKSNLTNSTRFNFYSDIDSTANSEIVRLNPLTWLIDSSTDNSFVNRWGGEIKRDGFNIRMFKQRGSNNGVQIRWRKNLSSYNVKWDDTTVVTRIRPIGYNGLTLPELYVDSPKLADYGDPIIKEIKYESVKVADENSSSDDNIYKTVDEAYTALRKLAAKEFNENHIDDPTVTADVSMISLKNTREYADVAELETIKQWDTIQLINERDNVDIQMRLNSYKYNPLNHEFTELKFISVNQSLTNNTSFSSIINGIASTVQSVSNVANQAQIAANGKNMIQRGDANPNNLTFNGTLTDGDIYWRSNGNKTEMWIYSVKDKAWGLVVDDATGIKADQAQATADGKNTISYTDTAPANPKVNDVWFEEKSDGTIITNIWNGTKWEAPTSSEVKQTQVDLESKIADAKADANKKIADTQSNLDKAKQDSNKLISDAQAELNTQADELKTVKQNAEDALNKSNGNSSSITDINADINKINGSLTIKANKSDIDAMNKTVSSQQNQITANTEGLQLKADKTSVDTLSQTVTNQTAQISVLNDEVAEKTAKTDFDNLTGRVTSAEQKVTANADGLNSTVSKMTTLQDQVNNSAVGTNLIIRNNEGVGYIIGTDSTAQSYADNSLDINYIPVTVGAKYTLNKSFDTGVTVPSDNYWRYVFYDTNMKPITSTRVATGTNPLTFTVPSGAYYIRVSYPTLAKVKMELGSTATDYSANPADNATVTSVTNVSQKADQVAADLATSNGDITQLKARATGWDSSIASANGKINTLQATSDGYAANISAIQNQLNNSAVGTNMLLQGNFSQDNISSNDGSTVKNYSGTTNGITYYWYSTPNFISVLPSTKYIVSLDSTQTSVVFEKSVFYDSSGKFISASGGSFTTPSNATQLKLCFKDTVGASEVLSTFGNKYKIKLEKGLVATDYSTNPEDNATTNYVDNQITATASTLSANLTSTTTTLKTYADNSATTKANAVQSNLDNLQVGGNNLIPLSNISPASSTQTAYDSTTDIRTFTISNGAGGSWGGGIQNNAGVKHEIPWNAYFTYSVEIMPSVSGLHWNSDTNSFPVSGSSWNGNDNDASRVVNDNTGTTDQTLIPNVWNKVWITYRNTHTSNTNKLSLYDNSTMCVVNNSGSTVTVKFRHFQGELGNKPTDWSLAVEDVKSYADTSATNAKNAAISTASSDATTKANNAQSNAIASAKTYADTQISATAGTFNVKTSAIQTQLDNSAVGTNLLVGTGSSKSMAGANVSNQNAYFYSLINGYNVSKLATVYGTQFTISFDWSVSGSSPSGSFTAQWNNVPWGIASVATVSSSNTSGHFSKGFGVGTTTANIGTMLGIRMDSFVGTLTISHVKIEKGSVATDWNLAPTDTDYTNMFTMDSNGITLDAHGVNNSNKTILLRGDHVKIDSSNPVVIPTINANVITSGTLDASKITVNKLSANSITSGTLNAANVNVINLNANNISSGTLTGVTFHQTSSGHDTYIDGNGMHDYDSSGNNAWINQGKLQVYDSNNQGFFMRAGSLQLTTQALWNSNANPLYGTIERDNNLFSQSKNGMQLVGANGVHIQTANSGWSGVSESQLLANGTAGTSIALNDNGDIAIGAAHLIQMYGGYQYTNGVNVKPVLSVGCSGTTENAAGSDMLLAARTISLAAGGNVTVTSGGFVTGGSAKIGNNFSVVGATDLRGSLSVAGSKNAIVQTSQGWAKINAYETAEYYFGDIGKINTGNGSKAKIVMDSLFLETVNTNVDYHVFLSSYGNGYAWVSEQGKDYFIIESNVPNLEVSYEVKAKRIGYEGTRLEIDEDFGKNSN